MRLPRDINDAFLGAWKEFLKNPVPRKFIRNVDLLAEGFRILLRQARVNIRHKKRVSNFITVNKIYEPFIHRVRMSYLLHHMAPERHVYNFELVADTMTNIVERFVIHGECTLRPQRMALRYLVERMVHAKIFKAYPFPEKLPNSRAALIDRDFVLVYGDANCRIKIAALKNETLVMRYSVFVAEAVPMYSDLEKQLTALWRRATMETLT